MNNDLINANVGNNNIVFYIDNKVILKLCDNGDIYVKEKLIENDKEVVEGLRMFLRGQAIIV